MNNFGIAKAIKVFLCASILVPVVLALMFEITNGPLLVKDTLPYRQCIESPYCMNSTFNETHEIHFSNKMYNTVFYNYITKLIPSQIFDGLNILFRTVIVIAMSNLVEAALYCHMFKYIKR